MNRQDHLMTQAMEECAEVAQRLSKAMRFGLEQMQSDQPQTNRERIIDEYNDLIAVMDMAGFSLLKIVNPRAIIAKKDKVERYLDKSRRLGTLTD